MKITIISTHLPRQCGLASFTKCLVESITSQVTGESFNVQIVAIDDQEERDYPPQVKYRINQHSHGDYIKIAQNINDDGTQLCIIQHEFGIFGGDSGVFLLSFVHALKVPFIVTLHTVMKTPSFLQSAIIKSLGERAQKLVVMSTLGAKFLNEIYNIPSRKIRTIEHGVPDLSSVNKFQMGNGYHTKDQKVLLTFGLLSRNKGIEQVIQALPEVVSRHPNVIYLVVGKTHPNVLKTHGERYRNYLESLVNENQLENNVFFINKFISEKQLFDYLLAADIYITPYLNEAQITSGTLSYAIGAGNAVISTPYWHAQELIGNGLGYLFDFKDYTGLSKIIINLLDHPQKLKQVKEKTLEFGKSLIWSKIGQRYVQLINTVVYAQVQPMIHQPHNYATNPHLIPAAEFDHLLRLTDDTGIIQHAKYGIPNLKEGYCLDDNSRALLASIMAYNIAGFDEALNLIPIYFSYVHHMQTDTGNFRNFLSFSREFLDEEGSEDAFGRTIWALGYLIKHAPNSAYYQLAEEIFKKASKHFQNLQHIRGIANTVIGVCYYLEKVPDDEGMEKCLNHMTDVLVESFNKNNHHSWYWFEDQLSYDNGILPLALFHAAMVTGRKSLRLVAEAATEFLDGITMRKGYLSPIGSNGWYTQGQESALYDQQATDVLAMVLLNYRAYLATKKISYWRKMLVCYQWFLGENDLRIPLVDHETKGCCDGLEPTGVNRNQGAESTLAYLISNLTIKQALEVLPAGDLEDDDVPRIKEVPLELAVP